ELLLLVDCSELKRTGIAPEQVAYVKNRAVLDHHISNGEPECSFGCVDPGASSTAILVYKLIQAANSQPDKGMASAILAGIAGDTGAFRFSNTTPEVLQVSGDLMERGADLRLIIKEYFMSRSPQVTALLGKVLSGIRYCYDGRLALAVIGNEDFCGIDKSELEGINAELNSIKGLRLSVLLREEVRGSWRCSFRSDGFVDCSRLAAAFGGGGHKNAAGCTVKADTAEEAADIILKEVAAWKASFA
ncbi:MAG: DHH family phosphoesterase, partial [Abditibacteriota bacterium]|nr:DHH family phosphoesterase [Abditibacteriota bacterium]